MKERVFEKVFELEKIRDKVVEAFRAGKGIEFYQEYGPGIICDYHIYINNKRVWRRPYKISGREAFAFEKVESTVRKEAFAENYLTVLDILREVAREKGFVVYQAGAGQDEEIGQSGKKKVSIKLCKEEGDVKLRFGDNIVWIKLFESKGRKRYTGRWFTRVIFQKLDREDIREKIEKFLCFLEGKYGNYIHY